MEVLYTYPPIAIADPFIPAVERVLTPQTLDFIADLRRHFNAIRESLLQRHTAREKRLTVGIQPEFLPEGTTIRGASSRPPDCWIDSCSTIISSPF